MWLADILENSFNSNDLSVTHRILCAQKQVFTWWAQCLHGARTVTTRLIGIITDNGTIPNDRDVELGKQDEQENFEPGPLCDTSEVIEEAEHIQPEISLRSAPGHTSAIGNVMSHELASNTHGNEISPYHYIEKQRSKMQMFNIQQHLSLLYVQDFEFSPDGKFVAVSR